MDEVGRSKERIRDDITKKYNEIESLKHRNDKEAIWAAIHICDDYMKKSKVKENTWMGESFRNLKKELEENIRGLYEKKTTHRWGSVEKHIEKLATRVNEAENEMIKRIRMVNEKARMTNLAKESAKGTGKTFMKYDPQRLGMIFTADSNPVKIHEVMGQFFKDNKNATYMLDYKECKRDDIRNKMMRVTKNHTGICYIKYNEKTGTYNFYDGSTKEPLDERALIWEGVRIWSSKERGFINQNAEQARLNKKKEYTKENVGPLYRNIPAELRKALGDENTYKFLILAESRLDDIVKEYQKGGYRLDYEEPITTKGSDAFLMQAKFSGTEGANVRAVFRKDDMKNEALFNIMKDNKGYLKAYLTERIREKWQETSHFALRDKVINKYEAITENTKVKEMDYGITSFITLVENLEGVHGETTKELVRLEQCLKNIKNDFDKAVKNKQIPTQDERSKLRDKVITLFLDYKSHDGSWASMTDGSARKYITEIFKAESRSSIQRAVSNLGMGTTMFNNTSREHIVQDIREDIQEGAVLSNKEKLIGNDEYDKCFKRINTFLKAEIKVDNEGKPILNKETGEPEISGNKNLIDKLYNSALSDWGVIPRDPLGTWHMRDKKIIRDLKKFDLLPVNADENDSKLQEIAGKLMDNINHKNYMAENFKITTEEIKSRFIKRKKELEEKNEKTDDEMNELTGLLAVLENEDFIEEQANFETKIGKTSLKYGGFNDIFHGVLSPWLIKKGGGLVSGDNYDIYNDSLGLGGFFDRSDKNSEQIAPILKDILIEVAITSVAIAAGTVTMGAGSAAIMSARAALIGAKTIGTINKLGKVAKIGKMCVSLGRNSKNLERTLNVIARSKHIKNIRTASELAQDGRKISYITSTAKEIRTASTVAREVMPKTAMVLEGTGFHISSTALHNIVEGKPITEGLNPFGSTYGPDGEPVSNWKGYVQSIAFLGVLKAIGAPLQKGMQSVTADMLGERLTESQFGKIVQNMGSIVGEMGSMMATEQVLSIGLEGKFSPVTTESMIHMVGMVLGLRGTRKLNKAAKWTIKKYRELSNGKGIEELEIQTEEGIVTLDKDGKVIESTDPGVPKGEDVFKEKEPPEGNKKEGEHQNSQENQNEELERKKQEIQRQREELTKKKEAQEKRKPELEKKKGELEKRKSELLRLREENRRSLDGQENTIEKISDILKKGNIIVIDKLKYQFLEVKNGKAVFVIEKFAKLSAIKENKTFSEKVEVSSLDELSDESRFNLEPGKKKTNSKRYQKLQELLGENVEPLDRLRNKIKNKEGEIRVLKEEIARLEKGKNTIAYNDYFERGKDINKHVFVDKHIKLWIDGVKYKASHLNDNGDIQFEEVDGNKSFTISSFKQLGKRVLGYNPYAKGYPTTEELSNHNFIKKAIIDEGKYLNSRNIQETINQKKIDLQSAQSELKGLQDKLPTSQEWKRKIDERARKGAEINKELGRIEAELSKVNEELSNTERLIDKYGNELSTLEGNESPLRNDLDVDGNNLGTEESSEGNESGEVVITREMLEIEFETKIYANEGININGDVYRLEFRNDPRQNKNRKGRLVWLKNGKVIRSVKAGTRELPDTADGNRIRSEYNKLREKYIKEKQGLGETSLESDVVETEIHEVVSNKQDSAPEKIVGELINYTKDNIEGFKNVNLSKFGQEFFDYYGKPSHTIELGNTKLFVSDVYVKETPNDGTRYEMFGYTDKGDLRFFYKSKSGGTWRSTPGAYGYKGKIAKLSKGEDIENYSYENTTQVGEELNDFFESLSIKNRKEYSPLEYSTFIREDDVGFVHKNMGKMGKETIIDKLFGESEFGGTVDFYENKSKETVIKEYENLKIEGLDYSEMNLTRSYVENHQFLGKIKIDVVEMIRNGKKINVHFAYAENSPGLVYIKNIVYPDANLNSYGIYDKQINAAPLVGKPLEYLGQCPSGFEREPIIGGHYRDIREIYQTNPLIKEYKNKFRGIEGKREEQQRKEQTRNIQVEETREKEVKITVDEIRNKIKNKIPELLKVEHEVSINSEFIENQEIHQNYIKTMVIKNVIDYTESINKKGGNIDLIEVLKGSEKALKNIPYEERIELINKINNYLESSKIADKFIAYESLGFSPKELFLRAKGLDSGQIKDFKGDVKIERFRNSIVFVFEKAVDVKKFFRQDGIGCHFESKIDGLDAIMINKENCMNAGKIGLSTEDALFRGILHEAQHSTNKFFMTKNTKIIPKEIGNSQTDIVVFKEYALDRAKDEIIAQYTNRLILGKLSESTIGKMRGNGSLLNDFIEEGGGYDYFKKHRDTPEGKKAREEYREEVKKMNDFIKETLESCKSNGEIQNMLNLFSTTDTKEWKNIKDIVKRREQQRKEGEEQQRKEKEEQERNGYTGEIKNVSEHDEIEYSKWNISDEVKEYLDNPNTCKPFFEVNLDGQQIFLTAPQRLFNKGFIGYDGYIGFIKVNGQYEIRYFIKSGSEGLWRCCPGWCGGNVSKLDEFNVDNLKPSTKEWLRKNGFHHTGNFSYERTTMVDFRLGQALEYLFHDIRRESNNEKGKYYPKNGYDHANITADAKDINKRKRFIDMSKEIDVTADFSKKIGKKMSECTIDEVKSIYKSETLGIDINSFTREKEKSYRYYHETFDCTIDVEVYTAKMGGKDIEIFFSHTENEPDLIWIDNIQYKNQTINSYGIASKQINAGRLTKKPMDYIKQCPKGYEGKIYDYDKYMDIRPLYQENPLIKKYKELSQQYRAAA